MKDLEIIIPVKNENKNITRVLDSFFYEVKTKFTVTVCFDDYKDTTIPAIKKYDRRQQFKIKLLKNKYYGINGAVKTAFENSSAKILLVYPADDFFNADKIDQLNELVLSGYEIVCPSRFMKGGAMHGCPFLKSVLTRSANFIFYHILRLPTHDATNCFRIFSRKIIKNIDFELQKGPTFGLQLLVKAHRQKYKITELPVVWYERVIGKSNFKIIEWVLPYMKWILYAINTAFSRN